MQRLGSVLIATGLGLGIGAVARAPKLDAQRMPAQAAVLNPATTPATIPKDRLSEDWWAARHAAVLAEEARHPDAKLILVGDSITQNYEKSKLPDESFQSIWQEFYAPRKAINLGFSGDATENVLWRLDHGEVDGLHPRAAVVLIGTNNTNWRQESAADTELGIDAVVKKLEEKLPGTQILLLGILPSGLAANVVAEDLEINRYLANKYGPGTGVAGEPVSYLDIGSVFFLPGKNGLEADQLDESVFYDPRLPQHGKALHPDTVGQRRLAEAIEPMLEKLLHDGSAQRLAELNDVNSALIPVPRLEMDLYDWYARHAEELALGKRMDPEVVLIGDSITHFWGGEPKCTVVNGPAAWEQTFVGIRVLNMGFGWDRTQNVLWRLRQGEFDGLHPKTVVINIGTNNLAATDNARSNTPEEIVAGIVAIHHAVRARSPESRIVVMGVFPRGFEAGNRFRAPIKRINQLLAEAMAAESNTVFLDIGAKFLDPDGTLPKAWMADGTHPTDAGYAIWGKALVEAGLRKGLAATAR